MIEISHAIYKLLEILCIIPWMAMSHLSKEGCSAVLQNLCWAALHRAQQMARRLKRPRRFGIGEDVWCVRNDVMGYHWYHDMQLSWAIQLFLEFTWAIPAIPWIPFWLIGRTCELGIQASSKDLPRGRNRGDDPRICRSLVNNIINILLIFL